MAVGVALHSNVLMLRKDSVQLGQHCPGERGTQEWKGRSPETRNPFSPEHYL